jgi:hypothetical protein
MKVIIYTVNIGGYDDLVPSHVAQSHPHITYKTYRSDEDNIAPTARGSYERSKRFRMASHLLKGFEEYDFAVYIDSNVEIINPNFISEILENHNEEKWDFLMSHHHHRNGVITEVMLANAYVPNKYSEVGLRALTPIAEECKETVTWCGFNVQWLKSPRYSNLKVHFNLWWDYIRLDPVGVADDQITWPIVYEKLKDTPLGIKFKIIKHQHKSNHYFRIYDHKIKQPQPNTPNLRIVGGKIKFT